MRDITKGLIAGTIVLAAAFFAETITLNAHGIAWEEAHGQPIITSMESFTPFTHEELEIIARCVQAEYGNGDETDKRLVVSVILNRLESDHPDFKNMDTIEKVVKAPYQFSVSDHYTLETMNAVYKEVFERTDDRVLWFCAGGYPKWGTPLFERNNHFFNGVME